jgi:hypothetical protein
MKLIALYSVFDGEELLEGSISQIRPHVDFVLCCVQTVSYSGETYLGGKAVVESLKARGLVDQIAPYQPLPGVSGQRNEVRKRFGAIQLASKAGFSHFFHVDCDEYFESAEFASAKALIENAGADGSVVCSKTYFKRPDWELEGIDEAFFPFIHRIHQHTASCGSDYPFWCDPTRTVNARDVLMIPQAVATQHHFSWVRRDVSSKVRNHSLSPTFKGTGILEDYQNAQVGSYIPFCRRNIVQGRNVFGIQLSQ